MFGSNKYIADPHYRINEGMGMRRDEFIKAAQKLYKDHKDKLSKSTKRPTSIKAAVSLCKQLGKDVQYRESNSNWFRI